MKDEIGADYTVIHIKIELGRSWDGPPFEALVGTDTTEWESERLRRNSCFWLDRSCLSLSVSESKSEPLFSRESGLWKPKMSERCVMISKQSVFNKAGRLFCSTKSNITEFQHLGKWACPYDWKAHHLRQSRTELCFWNVCLFTISQEFHFSCVAQKIWSRMNLEETSVVCGGQSLISPNSFGLSTRTCVFHDTRSVTDIPWNPTGRRTSSTFTRTVLIRLLHWISHFTEGKKYLVMYGQ